jgi:hypothetical protein
MTPKIARRVELALERLRRSKKELSGLLLVRCSSGRRTWKATVTLPDAGKVEFVFDVIY